MQHFICQQNTSIYIKIHQSLRPFIYNNGKMSKLCGKNENFPKFVYLHKISKENLCRYTTNGSIPKETLP